MPAPADDEGAVRVLRYSAELIAATVTITDGKLSGVALDVAGADDPALPNFVRAAWLGMNRATVLRILGTPAENHVQHCEGMNVEQMIFERPGGPDASIFLIDGRVAAKKVGRSFPADIPGVMLPLAPAWLIVFSGLFPKATLVRCIQHFEQSWVGDLGPYCHHAYS
jgi:hypothetical protein